MGRTSWTRSKTGREPPTPPPNYIIQDVLGEGAESTVYRATDVFLARDVVLKPLQVGRGHQSTESIQRSMALAAKIQSPYVNPALAAIVEGRNIWLVGGYAEGCSLRDLNKFAQLSDTSIYHVVADISHGLDAIHSESVVHNDLSPRNVIVALNTPEVGRGVAKVTDFGASSRLGDPCPGAGTPGYMAPEKAPDDPAEFSLDMFSLGAVISRLLTGAALQITGESGRVVGLPRPAEQSSRLRRELAILANELCHPDPNSRPGTKAVEHRLKKISKSCDIGSRDELARLVQDCMAAQKTGVTPELEEKLNSPSVWSKNRHWMMVGGIAAFAVGAVFFTTLNPSLPDISPTSFDSDVRATLPVNLSITWLDDTLHSEVERRWSRWPAFESGSLQLSCRCVPEHCQLILKHSMDKEEHDHLAALNSFATSDLDYWRSSIGELVWQATTH